jgi:hypothetical protein
VEEGLSSASDLAPVAADDNAGTGQDSRLSLPVAKGTKYRIAVAGVGDSAGRIVLRWHV